MEELDLNRIFSDEFLKKSFPEKRGLLSDYLLKSGVHYNDTTDTMDEYQNFKVGDWVLCYEDRVQDSEGSGHRWYMSGNDTKQKLKSITGNKFYEILDFDYKNGDLLIKIKGDTGRKSWVQANRFLVAEAVKKRLRKEKLKKLEDLLNDEK